jgi:retron-type reverse transcriptase
MSQPSSRQELYDRIRSSSKNEVILEEMIRLGFWPDSQGQPEDPATEIRRRGELERRLRELRQRGGKLHNIEALQREARKQRMAESRKRRAENKERKLRERDERARAWRARQEREIGYLGAGVSAGLNHAESDAQKLTGSGLPVLATAAEIAAAMGITVGALRFLAFSRVTSTTTHYVRFTIPKRTGGERLISAPMPRLKAAQRWILDNILSKREPHPAAHGFRLGRSIVTNARPHVGADVVVNVDLKDFFPTVTYPRVKGLFAGMGYSEAAATILALVCTEPEITQVELDGATYYVAMGERFLPQGAPTSPAVTNLLCMRLDRRLSKASQRLGFTYTRYADDLSFSASGDGRNHVGRLLRQVGWIVEQEGFIVHPDKTRVFRRSRRQEVTGVVVNDRPSVPRATLRRFRAVLFQIEKDGPKGKRWGQGDDVLASIVGFADYVAMVDPSKGRDLQRRARALAGKYNPLSGPASGRGSAAPKGSKGPDAPDTDNASEAPPAAASAASTAVQRDNDEAPSGGGKSQKKKWWKLF